MDRCPLPLRTSALWYGKGVQELESCLTSWGRISLAHPGYAGLNEVGGSVARRRPTGIAQRALALLTRLFRHGEISYHGGFINLASGLTSVLRIDPQCWKRTRRVKKHTTTPTRRQEEGSNVGETQRRTTG